MTRTDVLGFVAYLVLPLIGIGIWRVPFVRSQTLSVRLAVATAVGAWTLPAVMFLMSVAGMQWSRTILFAVVLLLAAGGVMLLRRAPRPEVAHAKPWNPFALGGVSIAWVLTLYGTVTARETCGDLHFTWGTKAVRFFRAGRIDTDLLREYIQLTTDYPPVNTLLFSWSNLVSHHFSWWSSLLLSPLLLIFLLAVVRNWSGDDWGTLLVAAGLTWGYAQAYPAGGAEPVLLLYETIVICALTFLRDPRAQTFYATLGVAGAVWTKLEGTTFMVATVLTILIVQRNARRALTVFVPAAILVGIWISFVFWNDIFLMYSGATLPIYFSSLPIVLETLLKVARFELFWLSWIAPLVLVFLGNIRRALVPLTYFVLSWGAIVHFYLHAPDPVWWIESSSPRVMLTPLLALLIAAVAAWSPEADSAGNEPAIPA
jgi:hypothetical protein